MCNSCFFFDLGRTFDYDSGFLCDITGSGCAFGCSLADLSDGIHNSVDRGEKLFGRCRKVCDQRVNIGGIGVIGVCHMGKAFQTLHDIGTDKFQ